MRPLLVVYRCSMMNRQLPCTDKDNVCFIVTQQKRIIMVLQIFLLETDTLGLSLLITVNRSRFLRLNAHGGFVQFRQLRILTIEYIGQLLKSIARGFNEEEIDNNKLVAFVLVT
jgi:hypothetical protein